MQLNCHTWLIDVPIKTDYNVPSLGKGPVEIEAKVKYFRESMFWRYSQRGQTERWDGHVQTSDMG